MIYVMGELCVDTYSFLLVVGSASSFSKVKEK